MWPHATHRPRSAARLASRLAIRLCTLSPHWLLLFSSSVFLKQMVEFNHLFQKDQLEGALTHTHYSRFVTLENNVRFHPDYTVYDRDRRALQKTSYTNKLNLLLYKNYIQYTACMHQNYESKINISHMTTYPKCFFCSVNINHCHSLIHNYNLLAFTDLSSLFLHLL